MDRALVRIHRVLCGPDSRRVFPLKHPVLKGADSTRIRRRLRTIAELFNRGQTALVPSLVAESVGLLTDLSPLGAARSRPYSDVIDKSCDELLRLSAENVGLEYLARRHGMSYPLFRREFKAQTGFSPHAYIIAFCLNRAKSLLRNSDLSIREIAQETGFSSLAYFSAVFQRHEGVSPRGWRSKNGL